MKILKYTHNLQQQKLLIQKTLFFGATTLCLTRMVSPPVALTLGMILALAIKNPFPRTSRKLAKYLLQACVILLGFDMNLGVVLSAGKNGAIFAAISIAATFILGNVLGKRLSIGAKVSVLISAGTAICGGSAIAAVSSVIGAAESEISVAMAIVFLLNAAALYIFPPLGHMLHLTPTQFGTWSGIAIHDISSVVGAALQFGGNANTTAIAVKLSRALWIIPVCLTIAYIRRRHILNNQNNNNKIEIPWFISLFVLASIIRTFVPGIASISQLLTFISEAGLTLSLFLIGAGLSKQAISEVGWKPLLQGLLLWIVISIASVVVVIQLVK